MQFFTFHWKRNKLMVFAHEIKATLVIADLSFARASFPIDLKPRCRLISYCGCSSLEGFDYSLTNEVRELDSIQCKSL